MNITETSLKKASSLLAALFCVGLLSACATTDSVPDKNDKYAEIDSDPIEPLNRFIFQFNHIIDSIILKPVAQGYDAVVPDRGKVMVSNFVSNIKEPVTLVNSVLQTDPQNSFCTLWRFAINSTVGIGGLFDAASEIGLKNRDTGFGDTLAIYGADAGPYIVIPILGPSNLRDGLGRLGDIVVDPVSYADNAVFYSIVGVKTVDGRYHTLKLLDDIYASSVDPYATIRSGYTQHRIAQIKFAKNARKKSLEAARAEGTK